MTFSRSRVRPFTGFVLLIVYDCSVSPCEEKTDSRVVVADTATADSVTARKSRIDEAMAAEGRDDRKTNSSTNQKLSQGFSVWRAETVRLVQAQKLPKQNLLKLKASAVKMPKVKTYSVCLKQKKWWHC